MTHEEIKALLLRPEAVRRMENALYAVGLLDAFALYADEAARTILQAQAGEQDERDAAVRALLDVSTRCVQESDAHQREYAAARAAVRRFYPEGK